MSYRDDAEARLARTQALEGEVRRLRAELDDARAGRPRRATGDAGAEARGPHAVARTRSSDLFLSALVARLPLAEQDLVTELVGLLTTHKDYPDLDAVTAAALEQLIVRLRATLRRSA